MRLVIWRMSFGRRARTDIFVEQPVLVSMVVDDLSTLGPIGNDIGAVIPEGMVHFTLPMSYFDFEGQQVYSIDKVDIRIQLTCDESIYPCPDDGLIIIHDAPVTALGIDEDEVNDVDATYGIEAFSKIMIAVSPENALILQHLVDSGANLSITHSKARSEDVETVEIVIALQPIAEDETITAEALAVVSVPLNDAPMNAIGNVDDILNKPTTSDIAPGQPILIPMIDDPLARSAPVSDTVELLVPEGMVAIGLPLSREVYEPNWEVNKPGNMVDIVLELNCNNPSTTEAMCPGTIQEDITVMMHIGGEEGRPFDNIIFPQTSIEMHVFVIVAVPPDGAVTLQQLVEAEIPLYFERSSEQIPHDDADKVQIVIAAQPIAEDDAITAEALAMVSVPLEDAPFFAIDDVQVVIGQHALTDIQVGQPVVVSMVVK